MANIASWEVISIMNLDDVPLSTAMTSLENSTFQSPTTNSCSSSCLVNLLGNSHHWHFIRSVELAREFLNGGVAVGRMNGS